MTAQQGDGLAVLRRIRASYAESPKPRPGERCELCTEAIPEEHGHLVDLDNRSLLCACRGCYLLFTPTGAGGGRYRPVPDRFVAFRDFRLSPEQWDALQIPVSVAFFFVNSAIGRVCAFYPSPAGATESQLPLEKWDVIVADNPDLATLTPDIEALLVRAHSDRSEIECYGVPIDTCYELVGELRRLWKGFDGGTEAHRAIDELFERVRARAQ